MGWAARANLRSTDGGTAPADAMRARIARFCAFFATREQYDGYLDGRDVSDAERAYLETMLPPHLRAQGTV